MKKIIALILAALLLFSLVACNKTENAEENIGENVEENTEENTEENEEENEEGNIGGNIAGGWSLNAEYPEFELTDDAKEAFDAAVEGLDGAKYTPVAFLGTQVVAGTNYAYVCAVTTVTEKPSTKLCLVEVYKDLEGNASIKEVKDINVADYNSADEEDAQLFGEGALVSAYTVDGACGNGLDEDNTVIFDNAFEGFVGAGYEPLVFLGSQVVAGSNIAVLCKATSVTAEPQTALAVVIIYTDLEGKSEVTKIVPFKF